MKMRKGEIKKIKGNKTCWRGQIWGQVKFEIWGQAMPMGPGQGLEYALERTGRKRLTNLYIASYTFQMSD